MVKAFWRRYARGNRREGKKKKKRESQAQGST
jgi:hypothetical protein